MEFAFTAKQLSVGYKGRPIVSDIDVRLARGQILTLIGPNGCGKSTILKSISRQLKTIDGIVLIDGSDLRAIDAKALARQAALVLTARPRPELMTAGDVVAVGRYPYTGRFGRLSEADREQIDEALASVDAFDLKHRWFDELSDGQQQRIMLARAICQQPDLIILDEPTSYLDIKFAVEIVDILRRMADEKEVTVIMSLHELNYAKRVSDLVMCIKSGRVVSLEHPDAVFNQSVISDLYDLPDGLYGDLFGGL